MIKIPLLTSFNLRSQIFITLILIFIFFHIMTYKYSYPKLCLNCDTDANYEVKCGEECDISSTQAKVRKHFDCKAIFKRMAYVPADPVINPAPKWPPCNMFDAFTMNGSMPIDKIYYFSEILVRPGPPDIVLPQALDGMIEAFQKNQQIGTYGRQVDLFVNSVIEKYVAEPLGHHDSTKILTDLTGTTGFVIGSLILWVEALLFKHGVSHVTTVEYLRRVSNDPRLSTYTPNKMAAKMANSNTTSGLYDFGFTFSSLEHSGLGRFGDPLNPYGDLEAMAQAWCMTRPGGLFFLSIPMHPKKGSLVWNAHRIYGPDRIRHMLANWDLVETISDGPMNEDDVNDTNFIYVLRKPLI